MGTLGAATVTSAMLQPIVDAVNDNVGVMLPIGIGIMAVFIGVAVIPRIVYKFF